MRVAKHAQNFWRHEPQTQEEFLLACIALILKEPDAKPRLIRFMRIMADRLEAQVDA